MSDTSHADLLRDIARNMGPSNPVGANLIFGAADIIEKVVPEAMRSRQELTRLREENEKLREALGPFVEWINKIEAAWPDRGALNPDCANDEASVFPVSSAPTLRDLRKARLALEALELGCQADRIAKGEPVSREGALQSGGSGDALTRLNAALSEFCNGATDEYLPSAWAEETKRNFKELCEAYNAAALAGIFKQPVTGQYGETKSDQAYQVIGTLATVGDCFNDPEVQRALDYFAEDTFDPKFLPFKIPQGGHVGAARFQSDDCGDAVQWDDMYEKHFPHRTDPTSRHVKTIAEALRYPESPMRKALADFDPDHLAGSLEQTVAMLWTAREENEWLKARSQLEERSDEVSAAGGEAGLTHKTLSDPHRELRKAGKILPDGFR